MKTLVSLLVIGCPALLAQKQEVCKVTQPTASYTIHFLNGSPELNTDPKSPLWSSAARATILKDCTHVLEYPALNSTVRGFWTDKDLFLLFECPYEVLNLWLPPMGGGPRVNLWDRDVVEMFLGDDWKSIRHYREFEIAPTGDWIDLAIDLDKKSYDQVHVTKETVDETWRFLKDNLDCQVMFYNGRAIGAYTHVDELYQAYLVAYLVMESLKVPANTTNPYKGFKNQQPFGTFGGPDIAATLGAVARAAINAVWYQKWYVHRRLRPEEYGGLVHNRLAGAAHYPLHNDVLNSQAVARTYSKYGTYLLPMSFPEGCPTHPAYGAGHATVAGACTTILKAWFDESWIIPNPVQSNADGTALLPISAELTVGDEINKLAANIAGARNMAGVHWRSDYAESVRLGERVAIRLLRESKHVYNELFSFTLTGFDGNTITI